MPHWAGADEVMRLINERRDFVLACAHMDADEDFAFLNKHLDLAFEGRHDHLRSGISWWRWVYPSPASPAHVTRAHHARHA